jgi:hypothetical protein
MSVVSANGFAGTVANNTTTPAVTVETTITGVLKGNGTAVSAATAGTDYSPGTSALATGIVKSTTSTGALTIATPGTDYLSPSTTGDVTFSGEAATLVGTANVEAIIRANDPSQLAPATANVSLNGFTLTSMAQAIAAASPATIGQTAGNKLPYILSGCVWTADSSGSSLNGSMTAGVVEIKGIQLTVAAITAHAFAASNDTYVDFQDNGDGTAKVTFTAVVNNTQSPVFPSSGTVLNSIRNAVIVTTSVLTQAVNSIIQGAVTATPTVANWAGTVASGSNTNPINTTTLSVTVTSGAAPVGGGKATVAHASGQTYTIAYTSASATTGTITLSGVTVLSGTPANTVSTGDVVTGTGFAGSSDMNGYRIYPASPSGVIAQFGTLAQYTTTLTSAVPVPTCSAVPFVVPAGANRQVKLTLQLPTLNSSAVAGSNIKLTLVVGNPSSSPTVVATIENFIPVASDGVSANVSSIVQLAPGSYYAGVGATQSASGTMTIGTTLLQTQIFVEMV